MAWTGMRPLATSWPPDSRRARAMGAAQRFSQTSTAALVPGFGISGAGWAFLGALVVTFVSWVLNALVMTDARKEA